MRLAARMCRVVRCMAILTVGGALGMWSVTSAQAATTSVNPPPSDEDSHAQIMDHFYGGSFEHHSPSLSNGSITAQRVDDDNDQVLSPGVYKVEAMALFANDSQWFGYMTGETGGEYVNLFDGHTKGYNLGIASQTVTIDDPFRWVRKGQGRTFTTQEADNSDGADHFVTYQIQGDSVDETVQMLFIEDYPATKGDSDFQDLVVRITPVSAGNGDPPGDPIASAPTPTAAAAGLALLLGAFFVQRPRRRDRRHEQAT